MNTNHEFLGKHEELGEVIVDWLSDTFEI